MKQQTKRNIFKAVGGVVVGLVVIACGIRGYMVWEQNQDLLPTFTEVPPGTRAPTKEFLGLELRKTTLAEAEVLYRGLGANCKNSSMRALMGAKRESVKKKMAEAKARGDDPDAVSGASLANYKSKKERNPQVRLACEGVPVDAFHDREHAAGENLYWLMIFDSSEHPLRHTSVSRRLKDTAIAAEEWRLAVAAMTKRFGAPTTLKDLPGSGDAFPQAVPFTATWVFADLQAEVSAFLVGDEVRLTEKVEVPWPVTTEDNPESPFSTPSQTESMLPFKG